MSRDAESGEGEFKESADRDGSPENLFSHILNREDRGGSRSHLSFVAVPPRPSHLLTVLIFLRSSSSRELWMVLQMQRATVRTCCGIIDGRC